MHGEKSSLRGMLHALAVVLAAVLGILALAAQAQPKPPRRVALVIGNDGYQHVSKLHKAGNDATAMARELRSAGFEVTLQKDLGYRAMVRSVEAFSGSVRSGDQVVVFFAGHGVQIRAGSYLLPVDIEATSEAEIEKTAYGLNDLTEKLAGAKAAFTLVLVDACRDNPLRANTGRSVGNTRGLAAIEPPRGQMVVYSASRGQQALDRLNDRDANPNGVFTREFIARMRQPGVRVEDMVRDVQDSVETLAKTVGHEQRPAIYNEARGSFYFFAPVAAPAAAQLPPGAASVVRLTEPALQVTAPQGAAPQAATPAAAAFDPLAGLRQSAESGDAGAMLALADRYAAGDGVSRNPREAESWYLKAAGEGSVIAEFKLSESHRFGEAGYIRDVQRILSLPVENLRSVRARDRDAVRRLVETDPFFDLPGGAGKLSFSYATNIRDRTDGAIDPPPVRHDVNCSRAGKLARLDYKYSYLLDYDSEGEALLGGILPLKEKIKTGMMKSYATELTQVESVHGQPFPLVPGKRFGMSFSRYNEFAGPETTRQTLACVADAPAAEGVPVMCVYQNNQARSRYMLARFVWNEASGCFAQRYESAAR